VTDGRPGDWTRRSFLTTAGTITAAGLLWPGRRAAAATLPVPGVQDDPDPALRALASRALDAARAAGASYADVRVTCRWAREWYGPAPRMVARYGLGVRALANGYWGFASTPQLRSVDASRCGHDAASMAIGAAAVGAQRPVDWHPVATASNGRWATAVTIDPMNVDLGEIFAWQMASMSYATRQVAHIGTGGSVNVLSPVQERIDAVFASTEGASWQQTFFDVIVDAKARYLFKQTDSPIGTSDDLTYTCTDELAPQLSPTCGWENVVALPVADAAVRTITRTYDDLSLPVRPVDIGRFSVVCDWQTMGSLVAATLGRATELDRAMGYEVNATGSSYLGPKPEDFLGSQVAARAVTLTADRSTPGAYATVGWDDEGIAPRNVTLVRAGELVAYQTTRESAGWLASPGASCGCLGGRDVLAVDLPLAHQPNLTLAPASSEASLDDLVRSVDHGYLICEGRVAQVDHQALNGVVVGARVYEIRKGKRVARVANAALSFRSPQLWSNLAALGGPSSARWSAERSVKGEPLQTGRFSVRAVPALFTDMAVIDLARRA
jgi:TldD protein